MSKLSSYCIIRNDSVLRTAIQHRMKIKGIDFHELAKYVQTDSSNVRKYIFKGEQSISQQKVLAIAAYLGIYVQINITFSDTE